VTGFIKQITVLKTSILKKEYASDVMK
jgi:hypothetical protein